MEIGRELDASREYMLMKSRAPQTAKDPAWIGLGSSYGHSTYFFTLQAPLWAGIDWHRGRPIGLGSAEEKL